MSNFDKILSSGTQLTSTSLGFSEPTVQLLHPPEGSVGFSEKIASEAAEWAKSVKPEPGKTFLLVLALGASEFYGPNRNGDGFRESELKKTYKTFETDAHLFKSHVNKDPAKAIGKVVKAFYNDRMHRVELIVALDNKKAPKIVEKIKAQEDVGVSMGCRIKYDVCSICGNKAANRSEYCKHAKFQMNEILSDGRVVYVDNPNPRFFDISVVWRPADRTGYMLKKVARDGRSLPEFIGSSYEAADKVAELSLLAEASSKAAEISKKVLGLGAELEKADSKEELENLHNKWLENYASKVVEGYQKVSSEDLKYLAGHDMSTVLNTLSDMGIFLTTQEFLDLAFARLTGNKAPAGIAEKLISYQSDILRYLSDNPEMLKKVLESGAVPIPGSTEPSEEIQSKMAKYQASRSLSKEWMSKRAFSRNMQLTYQDPTSGRLYRTDQNEVAQTQKAELFGDTAALVGAAALGLVTYRAMAAALGLKGAIGKILAAGTGATLGASTFDALSGGQRTLRTLEGEQIPAETLMVPMGSDNHPSLPKHLVSRSKSMKTAAYEASWVMPTICLADKKLVNGYSKYSADNFYEKLSRRSLNFEELSHTIGKVLVK